MFRLMCEVQLVQTGGSPTVISVCDCRQALARHEQVATQFLGSQDRCKAALRFRGQGTTDGKETGIRQQENEALQQSTAELFYALAPGYDERTVGGVEIRCALVARENTASD